MLKSHGLVITIASAHNFVSLLTVSARGMASSTLYALYGTLSTINGYVMSNKFRKQRKAWAKE
jgi:multidrug transporter EmrE-like cation transporter